MLSTIGHAQRVRLMAHGVFNSLRARGYSVRVRHMPGEPIGVTIRLWKWWYYLTLGLVALCLRWHVRRNVRVEMERWKVLEQIEVEVRPR